MNCISMLRVSVHAAHRICYSDGEPSSNLAGRDCSAFRTGTSPIEPIERVDPRLFIHSLAISSAVNEVDKMTTLPDQEPEINIYVGDNKLDSSKRSLAKQNTIGKPSKKQKVKPSANGKPVPRTEANTAEESSERNRPPDASYRHLFSFANEQDEKPQPGKSATSGFSFLKADNEITDPEKEKATTAFQFPHKDEIHSDLNETQVRHSPSNSEDYMEIDQPSDAILASEYPDRHRPGYEHMKGRRLTSQGSNHQRHENFEMVRRQASDTLMIPEDIEFRPDELLRLATRFCRQQSLEELEEEWGAPGGTRETMKRDFKQKRQNISRGRKLGSSNKR